MNPLVLLADPESGGQIEEIARTFGVTWPHLVSQILSFAIVCLLLYRFAYRPILKVLAERRQLIAEGLANSERIKAQLARTEADHREAMAQAAAQAAQFLDEGRVAAARVREQETQKAIATAEQIMAKAREAAASDHTRMLGELKREVGRLVVETTAAVSGKVLTADDQQRLAEETAKELLTH
jgi:F-type H+-transporting ATPase subunit b